MKKSYKKNYTHKKISYKKKILFSWLNAINLHITLLNTLNTTFDLIANPLTRP